MESLTRVSKLLEEREQPYSKISNVNCSDLIQGLKTKQKIMQY
jgi:hypothetical protein